jgi:hypothetical protein
MIASNPSVMMAERMAFWHHGNPSSHIAYIQDGHNSDFAFQKAISSAPITKKKEILEKKSTAKKVTKIAKSLNHSL